MRPEAVAAPPGFTSILFPGPGRAPREAREPAFFPDLNLDQIVRAASSFAPGREIAPFFHTPLDAGDDIVFRQEVLRDLESQASRGAMEDFSRGMRAVREGLERADKLSFPHEKDRWFLAAAEAWCKAVEGLLAALREAGPASQGLRLLEDLLAGYLASPAYRALATDTRDVASALHAIRYGLLVEDARVTIRPCEGQEDYGATIERTFAKFRREPAKDYRVRFTSQPGMNHVEVAVLERVALLHPAPFRALSDFRLKHVDFQDERLVRFEEEVQFYLAWLSLTGRLRLAGLPFCYPEVSRTSKEVRCRGGYDLALALASSGKEATVVPNDFDLRWSERILVVSGPNQGGKTTFARMFGQAHYLAALGLTVPGVEARLFHFDRMFSHFETAEDVGSGNGRLRDDLVRMRGILEEASPDSIVIVNEVFSSTTLADAVLLGRRIMARLSGLDAIGVWVTFLHELASFDEKTVSVVCLVDPADPARRTWKLKRRPAGGPAHALLLAEKRRVTYALLKERIRG